MLSILVINIISITVNFQLSLFAMGIGGGILWQGGQMYMGGLILWQYGQLHGFGLLSGTLMSSQVGGLLII